MQQILPLGFKRQAYSDRKPVLMILLRQFLALKWGSGKQMKIISKLPLGKYWHRCLIVLVLTTPICPYFDGYFVLIPLIFSPTKLTNLSRISIPSINLSGKRGARANKSPPKPQPISTIDTPLFPKSQPLGCQQKDGCSTVLQEGLRFCSRVPPR